MRTPAVHRRLFAPLLLAILGQLALVRDVRADDAKAESKLPLPLPPRLADNARALPGFIRLSAPVPSSALVSVAASGSYGQYSPILDMAGPSYQLSGLLAVGVTPIPYFSARLLLRGDYSEHSGSPYPKTNTLYGEPELAVRAQFPLSSDVFVGAELEARLVGAQAPNIEIGATTITTRALGAYNYKKNTWFSTQLGFRFDNSANAFEGQIEYLMDGDRQTLHASSFNAFELGFAASHRFDAFELIGEVSSDIQVGKGAPSFGQGPISFDIGGRYDILPNLVARGHFEYSPSTTPDPYPTDVLIATRPRFEIGLGLTYRFFDSRHDKPPTRSEERAEKKPIEPPKPVVVAPPPSGKVSGRILDEAGQAISDVMVVLTQADEPPIEIYSDENGVFSFDTVTLGSARVMTKSPGYDPVTKDIEIKEGEEIRLDYVLYESLPAGQVRGNVLDFAGAPILATVTVDPGNLTIPVEGDGGFSLDLKPGRYKVRFEHPGYTSQIRVIRVQDKGVVVLNIALEKKN